MDQASRAPAKLPRGKRVRRKLTQVWRSASESRGALVRMRLSDPSAPSPSVASNGWGAGFDRVAHRAQWAVLRLGAECKRGRRRAVRRCGA